MSRIPSASDKWLLAAAEERGAVVSARQLERWRQHGLVPRATRTWLGRGRGSTSEYQPEAVDVVVAAADAMRTFRRLDDALLILFVDGHPVDGEAVRRAYLDQWEGLLEVLADGSVDSDDPFAVADAAAPLLTKRMLRDRRGRGMRRRLRGFEDSADAVLTGVVTSLLMVLQQGEFLSDEGLGEFAQGTGLESLWSVEIAGQGTLAEQSDVRDALERTATSFRLDTLAETIDNADHRELRDAASELRSLSCTMRDLFALAVASDSSSQDPWPTNATVSDERRVLAHSAPAWLHLRRTLPGSAREMVSFVLAQHTELHTLADKASRR